MNRITAPLLPVAIVTGPTASGKTGVSLEFARSRSKNGAQIEIVNADSLLVYRGFDIGTAKPTRAEREEIPHHLIDIREATEPYTAGDFVREVDAALAAIHGRGNRALIVGGTGFYLKALVFGLWDAPKPPTGLREEIERDSDAELYAKLLAIDEESALRITVKDRYRLVRAWETYVTTGKTPTALETEAHSRGPVEGLSLFITDRESRDLEERIALRTRQMIELGFLDEVKALRTRYPGARPFESVGYVEAIAYLDGRAPAGRVIAKGLSGLETEIRLATRQLSKRQRTFLKGQFRDRFNNPLDHQTFVLDRDRDLLNHELRRVYGI